MDIERCVAGQGCGKLKTAREKSETLLRKEELRTRAAHS